MATTTTLTANGSQPVTDQGYIATGTTSLVTAVNDSSDSTYIRKPASGDPYSIYYNVTTVASLNETTNIPWRIRVLARLDQGSNGSTSLYVRRPTGGYNRNNVPLYDQITKRSIQTNGAVTKSGAASVASVTGGYIDLSYFFTTNNGEAPIVIKQSIVDGLQVGFYDASTSAGRASLFNLSAELQTTTQSTTAIAAIDGDTTPSYAVTTTSRPLIEWTYSQGDSISQTHYEVSVFSASAADPTSSTNRLWTSGQVASSSARSVTPTVDFTNGTNIFVYIRTGFALGGTIYWSTWASSGSTSMSFTSPTVPTLTATVVTGSQRVTLNATGAAPATGTQTFDIQRSDDGGTTWDFIRDGAQRTPSGSFVVTVLDYEVPRGISAQYRARAVGVVSNQTVTGAWSTVQTVTTANDRTHWLKRMGSTTAMASLNTGGLSILADPDFEVEEQTTVLRPLGRTDAVVVAGAIGKDDGAFNLVVPASTWDAVKANLTHQGVLLWQDPYGTQKYIRITRRSWRRLGDKDSPRYEASVQFVEVGAP